MRTFLTAALFAVAASATAQTPDYAGMDTLLNRIGRAHKASGSALFYKAGRVLYQHQFGQATTQNGAPVLPTSETAYRVGSITKVYTAAMIWQLIDAGTLTTETPLATFFPQLPNAKTITIGHLLSHHSGLYNFTNDLSFGAWSLKPHTRAELLALFAKGKPVFQPGTKGEYSNTNYVLLAFILEDLTKKSYAVNVAERIAGPLHLTGTRAGTSGAPAANDAASYAYKGTGWQKMPLEDLSTAVGAGNIVATPLDIARFLEALMTGKLISGSSLARMEAQADGFGMGLFQIPFGERRSYGHGGHIDGFNTMADYAPADSLQLVLACNGVNTSFNNISIGLLSLYYGRSYQMPDYAAPVATAVDPAVLQRYVGTYTFAQAGMDVTVRLEDGKLTAQATGQSAFPLTAVSETEFSFEPAGIVMVFQAPKDGVVKHFTLNQGGSVVPFERKP